MTQIAQALALILASFTIGWTACLCFLVAPGAFRWLKHGRSDTFIRNLIKEGHGFLGLFSLLSAGMALIAGSWGGAAVMGCAALFYVLAQWTLAPKNQSQSVPGMRTNRKRQRIAASMLTAFIMPVVLAGMVLIALQI